MATDLEMASKLNRKFAYIFDLDGVIIDSMINYYLSIRAVILERFGVDPDRDFYLSMSGMSISGQLDGVFERYGISGDKDELIEAINEHYLNIIHTGEPISCNIQLLKLLIKNGTPVAVASGSSGQVIDICMKNFDIKGVSAIVPIEEVKHGKPNPEAFLLAAKKLGFPPRDCVVVEDSDAGAQAAMAAGMRLLHFNDTRQ